MVTLPTTRRAVREGKRERELVALHEKPGKFTIVTTIVIATGEDLNNISSPLSFFSFPTTGKKVRERNCRLENVVEPFAS